MSANLISQFHKLEIIAKTKTLKARKLLLTEFSKDNGFCKAVREVVKNTKLKNINLNDKDRKKINKYKLLLTSILKKKQSHKRKQQLIRQTGTGIFLPIVVPIVAQLLASLLNNNAVR